MNTRTIKIEASNEACYLEYLRMDAGRWTSAVRNDPGHHGPSFRALSPVAHHAAKYGFASWGRVRGGLAVLLQIEERNDLVAREPVAHPGDGVWS